jgi:phosphatidylinositol-3-phosphatase
MKPGSILLVGAALLVLAVAAFVARDATGGTDDPRPISCGRSSTADGRSPEPASRSSGRSHVFVIVLENREYPEVIGNPEARYINCLARRYTVATRYFAITHPSLPNYLAMIGGSTFAIGRNCTECSAAALLPRRAAWAICEETQPVRLFPGAGHEPGKLPQHGARGPAVGL